MGIKKNFFYNSILTVAGYIFPLITFPYITRVLGVDKVGVVNFVDGIINYFILFSTLGIPSIGIREIAKCKNQDDLKKVFSSLLALNLITTVFLSLVLVISIYTVPSFATYRNLLWIGLSKLIFSLFLIEWFFQGIQNFKYITYRTILVRIIFVVCIFLFVKKESDYWIYYLILISTTILNSLFNLSYSRKFVNFSFKEVNLRNFIKPFLTFGLNRVLVSLYTSLNVIVLGFVAGTVAVGYYTTATKLYVVIMAFFTALTGAIIPKMSKIISEGKYDEVKLIVYRTIDIILIISFPVIFLCEIYAPEIIFLIAGRGFEGAILPFRIVIILLFIIAIEQIFNQQLLMCLNENKGIILTTLAGAIVGILLNVLLVPKFGAIGSSLCWMVTECFTLGFASYFVYKYLKLAIPYKLIIKSFIISLPYLSMNILIRIIVSDNYISFSIAIITSLIYFFILNYLIKKDSEIYKLLNSVHTYVRNKMLQ